MTVPVKMPVAGDIMESVLIKGDLAKLTADERVRYYNEVCRSLGLNPLTKPFDFILLNGKLQLYALRACADQLRKINAVSLEVVSREVADGVLTVHVRAKLPDGRVDEDLGSVAYPDTLKGDARANAELKAVTKAKRRATLSICGLGWLDETEIQDIPASAKRPAVPAPNVMLSAAEAEKIPDGVSSRAPSGPASASSHDADAGTSETERLIMLDHELAEAAARGMNALRHAWSTLTEADAAMLRGALDNRHKPAAAAADKKGNA